ncbi:MAG: alpha/beta fold hydrolase, partial [Salinibacter sp.]
ESLFPLLLGLVLLFAAAGCQFTPSGPEKRAFTVSDALRLEAPQSPVLSPDGKWVAYIQGDSLLAKTTGRSNQEPDFVAQGVEGQVSYPVPFMEWSPSGSRLLFRTDGSDGNGRLQVADVAADSSVVVRAFLPDSLRGSLRTFQNFYAGGPKWSPDGEHIALLAIPPKESSLEVYVADVVEQSVVRWTQGESAKWSVEWSRDGTRLFYATGSFTGANGAVKSLARPTSIAGRPKVVHTDDIAFLRDLLRSPSGDYLLARMRSGTPVLLEANSGDFTKVTSHGLPNRDYKGWSSDGRFLLTDRTRGMSSGLEVVRVPSGSTTALSSSPEHHTLVGVGHTSAATTRLLYRAESGSSPPRLRVADWRPGHALQEGHRVTTYEPWMDSVAFANHKIRSYQTGEGDTLQAQLFLPPESVDAEPPYPAVVIPYGRYSNEFPSSSYFLDVGIQPLASKGYAVIRPNTRDSRDLGNYHYGSVELDDTNQLLTLLADEHLIDRSRVSVIGHSHGGALTYYYASHSDCFCAAVPINGAADWVYQAKLRRMAGLPGGMSGPPSQYPEEYERASPLANARRVTTPLLAVSGGEDNQIPSRNARAMVSKLDSLGKPARHLHFSNEGHLLERESTIVSLWEAVFDFLSRHCAN